MENSFGAGGVSWGGYSSSQGSGHQAVGEGSG